MPDVKEVSAVCSSTSDVAALPNSPLSADEADGRCLPMLFLVNGMDYLLVTISGAYLRTWIGWWQPLTRRQFPQTTGPVRAVGAEALSYGRFAEPGWPDPFRDRNRYWGSVKHVADDLLAGRATLAEARERLKAIDTSDADRTIEGPEYWAYRHGVEDDHPASFSPNSGTRLARVIGEFGVDVYRDLLHCAFDGVKHRADRERARDRAAQEMRMIAELKLLPDDVACRPVEPASDEQVEAWFGWPK
ncbi:hypothetical protein [Tomitella gaofuii]|uniref:hypothetical protein n=1 Tax=Tomitella gaofuii TaxID=2760083 RepID=UPI0015FC89E4|nr:hypothetical protein [Tomitella gaofuii]